MYLQTVSAHYKYKILDKFLVFLKQRYLSLILVVIVGTVSVLPQFLAVRAIGSDYEGIHFMYTANEDVYMARIQEVVDGHWGLGSVFFSEYKDWPTMLPPLGEYFYALPVILSPVSLSNVLIASKFLLPAVLFLAVYYLIVKLSRDPELLSSKLNAAVGGLLVTLGYDLIDYQYVIGLFRNPGVALSLPLWTRPVNPIIGAILIFIFLLLILSIIKRRAKGLFIPAGLVWALAIGYVFSWTFILVILLLFILLYLYRKDYFLVKNFFFVFAVWFLATLPYWYGMLNSMASPGGSELAVRNGMSFTHAPVLNKLVIASSILFLILSLYFKYIKKDKSKDDLWWWFCLVIVISSWIVFNQQIITGRTVWYYHYVQYTIPTLMVVMMLLLNNWIKPYFFKIWSAVMILIVLLVVSFNFLSLRTVRNRHDDYKKLQSFAPVFAWINSNTVKDCVVLNQDAAGVALDMLIPAFTHCNVYAPSWTYDGVPIDRVWHNYLAILRLRGVDPSQVKKYLEDHQSEVRGYFFTDWNQMFGSGRDAYIEKKIDQLAIDYQGFVKDDFLSELKRYKLDYILFVGQPTQSIFTQLPKIKLVYRDDNYSIYQIFNTQQDGE